MFAAIDASALNAFCHLDREQAASRGRRRRRVAAVRRRADRRQGARPGRRLAVHPRLRAVRRPRSPRPLDAWSQRIRDHGGAVLAGQTTAIEFGGVNVTRTVLHGTTAQPVAARPHAGRLVGRLGGGRRRRARHAGHRRRRRRLDPHPGRLLRARRAEGDVRAHPAVAARRRTATSPSSSAASPARCATRPAGSTSPTATTPRDPLSLPRVEGWEAGLGTLRRRAARAARRRRRRLGRRRRLAGDVGRCSSGAAERADRRRRAGAGRRRRHRRCRAWAGRGRSAG